MSANITIAIAAIVQAVFTVILVIVYVRKQTKIMHTQGKISEYIALVTKCVGYMNFYELSMRKNKDERSDYEKMACRKIEDTVLKTMDALEELELDIGTLRKQSLNQDSHY